MVLKRVRVGVLPSVLLSVLLGVLPLGAGCASPGAATIVETTTVVPKQGFEALSELGRGLERMAPHTDALCVPWKWGAEHDELLAAEIQSLDPWLVRVAETLTLSPIVEAARLHDQLGASVPNLGRTRNQANVLCGAAVHAARMGRFDDSISYLAQAHQLGHLVGDHSEWSGKVSRMVDHILADAVVAISSELAGGTHP